jgi:restriction endonuclease Mrr
VLSGSVIQGVVDINDELIAYLATHPDLLRDMHTRSFERLVAAIFKNQGFDVELTPATREGGFDIIAAQKNQLGNHLYLIECKRYSMSNKVGVDIVRGLYGNKMAKRATMGIIATTSFLTKDAVAFAAPLQYELSPKGFRRH